MLVLYCEHKFNELMRYACEVVSIEADKCQNFLDGLWPKIMYLSYYERVGSGCGKSIKRLEFGWWATMQRYV